MRPVVLAGHGVHVVTVNDYLARRDARWMAPIFTMLGLSVGDALALDFKWWDNAQKPGDIMDTYLSGDCAPEGRFNYRFTSARATR